MKSIELKTLLNDTRLNFLIGSGASRPHFSTLCNIEKAFTLADGLDNQNKAQYIRMLCARRFAIDVIRPELEIGPNLKRTPNLNAYNTLSGYKLLFSALSDLIAFRETPVTSKTVNIFTTNYDTCMEHSLEDLGILYNDGFVGHMNPRFDLSLYGVSYRRQSLLYEYVSEIPSFNLFKLHGSLNWKLEDSCVVLDRERSSAKECCALASAIEKPDEVDVNDLKALQNHVDSLDDCSLASNEEAFLDSYNKLVLVSPTKRKFEETLIDRNYYEMLRMMSNELEKENALLCVVGFSFADEHIREIVARSLVQNPTLTVVYFAYSVKGSEDVALFDEFAHLPYSNLKFITPNDVEGDIVDVNVVARLLRVATGFAEASDAEGGEQDA